MSFLNSIIKLKDFLEYFAGLCKRIEVVLLKRMHSRAYDLPENPTETENK